MPNSYSVKIFVAFENLNLLGKNSSKNRRLSVSGPVLNATSDKRIFGKT